jgi:beta-lactamase regulating signal transducer with metallopeptidase domain
MFEQINAIAQGWWNWMWPMFWQVSVLVVLLGIIDLLLRRHIWPQVRYALWLLVLVKLILPPGFAMSTSVVSQAIKQADGFTTQFRASNSPAKPTPVGSSSEMNTDNTKIGIKPFSESVAAMSIANESPVLTVSGDIAGSDVKIEIHRRVYLMAFWLIVMVTLFSWATVRFRKLRRFHIDKLSNNDLPQWFGPLLIQTAEKLDLRALPEISLSRHVSSPAVFGAFRPVIVLPETTINHLSREHTEHILLHELAHIKRRDLLVNTLYMLLQIVYWFNPLLWFVRLKLQHLRELCCDATVAGILRNETVHYRDTILEVTQRFLSKPAEPGIGLLGMVETSSRLLVRLKWLEKKTWKYRGIRFAIIFIVVGLMTACVLPMAKAKSAAVSRKSDTTAVGMSDIALLYHSDRDIRIETVRKFAENSDSGLIDDLIRAHSVENYTPVHNEYDRVLHSLTGNRNVRGKGAWKAWLDSEVKAGWLKIDYVPIEPAAGVRNEILPFVLAGPNGFDEMAADLTAAAYDRQKCHDALRYMVFNDHLAQVQGFLSGNWLVGLFAHRGININDIGYFLNGLANPGPLRKQIDAHVRNCFDSDNPVVVANALNLIAGVEGYSTRFIVPDVEDKVKALTSGSVPEVAHQARRALERIRPVEKTNQDTTVVEVKDGLRIKAFIDGKDTIKIKGTKLWYEHHAWNLPGKWWDRANNIRYDEPTYINGVAWKPEWEGNISKPYRLERAVPMREANNRVKLTKVEARGSVSIAELPRQENDYTLSILLDDNRFNAAQWHEFIITWDSSEPRKQGANLPPSGLGEDKEVSVAKNILQQLVDSTPDGRTVVVPKGIYAEPVTITKSITFKGESRNECILEVTANEPAIFIDTKGKGRVKIEDLTIKWQLATSDRIEHPFAVAVKDTVVEVKNCCFQSLGNFKRCPVAINSIGFSELNIDICRFEGFEYTVCFGQNTKGTIHNSLVMDSGHQGISVYSDATAEITGNVVTGSRYHAVRSTGGTLNMTNNLIINNANRGVYLGNKSARGTIANNVIIGNGTGIGGFARSNVKVENNIIADSSYAGIGFRDSCSLSIRNNIFQADERGWILFREGNRNSNTVYKNTFWHNKIDTENMEKTANSVMDDPGFVDPENGDFSLKPGPALQQKQGLTNPEIFKKLWKIWKNRENKNMPLAEN